MAFPNELPKFNRYSHSVAESCDGKLLEHQKSALETLQRWFYEDDSRIAVVSMPTGSGKSGVICCLPYFLGGTGLRFQPGYFPTGNPRHCFTKPVLVLTPDLEITKQLERQIMVKEDKNDTFFSRRGIVPEEFLRAVLPDGLTIEGTQQLTQADTLEAKDLVISNVQKFLSKKQLPENTPWWVDELPDDLFTLVIVDEAHHFPAPTWKRIIDKFKGRSLVVFFTATPYKTSSRGPDGKPQWQSIVSGELAYHLKLEVARSRSIIRRTDFHEVTGEISTPQESFGPVLCKVKELQSIKNRDKGLPGNVPHMAIAVTKNTEEANEAASMWNKYFGTGTAIAYHSKVGEKELPKFMKRIKENKVQLVVVVAKLMEGFDHPPISIAAILTGIKSPRKFVQFVGRAQRIFRYEGGQESVEIVADIVTHTCYNQRGNYENFNDEVFVKP